MLFNSYEFILAFLPATVLGFLALGGFSRSLALGWLILASIFFYAWWRPFNLWILFPSIAVNFLFARALLGLAENEFVSKEQIAKFTNFSLERDTDFRLSRLHKLGLIYTMRGAYVGYTLNFAGYDCLAINRLVKSGVLEAFGKPLGVGKEADVFDALTSVRPYKGAWSMDDALDFIRKQAGESFDPRLAFLFVELRPEIEQIMQKYRD